MSKYFELAAVHHAAVYGDVEHGPKWLAWSLRNRMIVKILFVATIVLGLIAMICFLVLWNNRFAKELIEPAADKIISWFRGHVDALKTTVTVNANTNPPTYFNPITQQTFDDIYKYETDFKTERSKIMSENVNPRIQLASGLSVLVSFLPTLVMLGMFLVACCFPHLHVRYPRLYPVFTYITALISYLLCFVYCILCITLFLMGFAWTFVCGEQDLYLSNNTARGAIYELGVKECISKFPNDLKNTVDNAAKDLASGMCDTYAQLCEVKTTGTTPPFVCPGGTGAVGTTLSTCTTYAQAAAYYNSFQMKDNAATKCANIDSSQPATTYNISQLTNIPAEAQQALEASGETTVSIPSIIAGSEFVCDLTGCSQQCTDVTAGTADQEAIAKAKLILEVYDEGTKVNTALEEHARPLTDCQTIISTAVGTYTTCGHTTFLFYFLAVIVWLFHLLFMGLVVFLWILQSATPIPPPRPLVADLLLTSIIPDNLQLSDGQSAREDEEEAHQLSASNQDIGRFGIMQREDFEDLVEHPPEPSEAAMQDLDDSL